MTARIHKPCAACRPFGHLGKTRPPPATTGQTRVHRRRPLGHSQARCGAGSPAVSPSVTGQTGGIPQWPRLASPVRPINESTNRDLGPAEVASGKCCEAVPDVWAKPLQAAVATEFRCSCLRPRIGLPVSTASRTEEISDSGQLRALQRLGSLGSVWTGSHLGLSGVTSAHHRSHSAPPVTYTNRR